MVLVLIIKKELNFNKDNLLKNEDLKLNKLIILLINIQKH